MANIPVTTRFIGIADTVNLVEKKSAQSNAETQPYTMQDIIDTVPASGASVNPTSGFLPLNNAGEFIDSSFKSIEPPMGYVGIMGFETKAGIFSTYPPGYDASNIASWLPSYGLYVSNNSTIRKSAIGDYSFTYYNGSSFLCGDGTEQNNQVLYGYSAGYNVFKANVFSSDYHFGNASNDVSIYVSQASTGIAIQEGAAIIGCGMSSPTAGVFKAESPSGIIRIGTNDGEQIGVSPYDASMIIGSSLMNTTPPANAATVVKWANVVDGSGNSYKFPLYQ